MSRKIAIDDFMRVSLLSDPQISPDESRIALVRRYTDDEKSRYQSEIWMVPAQGGEPRRFVSQEGSNTSPRWSPNGETLAFLSSRQAPDSQIFLIPADGGEARALTQFKTEGSFSALRWSPDGAKIAFLYRETPAEYTKAATDARAEKKLPPPARKHLKLRYRMDAFGYYEDSYAQVWVADAATGEAKRLTDGKYACDAPVWSPDGKTLAFFSDRREDWDVLADNTQLYTVPAEGGELTLIPSPLGAKHGLAWSPDGNTFAYAGNPDPDDWWGTENTQLFLLPATGGEAVNLTGRSDMSAGYETLSDSHDVGSADLIQWTADSGALFFPMSVRGDVRLCFIEAKGGNPVPVSPAGCEMGDFAITASGIAAVTLASHAAPQELFVLQHTANGLSLDQRTRFHQAFLDDVAVIEPEEMEVPNGDGGFVHGWLLKPADFDPAQKYPFILYIHGGPHAQYGATFFHELQYLAAEGYVVLYTNPRGSKGYGKAHTAAIKGDWGNKDYEDLMRATDYALSLDFVDETRTAVMGGSYGGFMTAWMIGHTTRFTCAIADRLVANLVSMAGTCDFPWPPDAYFKGDHWSRIEDLWRHSPIAYAGNIVTPLLLIHSDGDLRCPHGQAEEFFSALRLQRKTVEYVRYPEACSHGMSRNGPPSLRLHRLQENVNWLGRWLKPEGD